MIAGDSLTDERRALCGEGGGGEIYGAAMHDRQQRRTGSIFRRLSIRTRSDSVRSAIEDGGVSPGSPYNGSRKGVGTPLTHRGRLAIVESLSKEKTLAVQR